MAGEAYLWALLLGMIMGAPGYSGECCTLAGLPTLLHLGSARGRAPAYVQQVDHRFLFRRCVDGCVRPRAMKPSDNLLTPSRNTSQDLSGSRQNLLTSS